MDYGSVYASKSWEALDGRRLWIGWVYETAAGCTQQCSQGTPFTKSLVSNFFCSAKPHNFNSSKETLIRPGLLAPQLDLLDGWECSECLHLVTVTFLATFASHKPGCLLERHCFLVTSNEVSLLRITLQAPSESFSQSLSMEAQC